MTRRERRWSPQGFACGFGTGDAGLGVLDKQITLEPGHRIDDVDGHLSSRTGEIDPAEGEAMDPDANFFEFCHGRADIDGIMSEPVEPGDDKYIASFYPVDELGEPGPLRDCH